MDILEPWKYIGQVPGKNIRGKLIDAFQHWLAIPDECKHRIRTIVSNLHDASLLIDDIEDNSDMRRGVPVAHAIYGLPCTINCANYVYFMALQECHQLGNDTAMKVYVKEMLNLHKGQGMDIYWRDHGICPTEDEYIEMVKNKTGGLFRLAVGMMMAFSRCDLNVEDLLDKMAVYFQIRDDLLNLVSLKYMEHKSFCEDITEGKFSYPLIHAIRSDEGDHQILNILKQHTKSVEIKKHALKYMMKMGSLEYTKKTLDRYYEEIVVLIKGYGGNEQLSGLMKSLHAPMEKEDLLCQLVELSNNKLM